MRGSAPIACRLSSPPLSLRRCLLWLVLCFAASATTVGDVAEGVVIHFSFDDTEGSIVRNGRANGIVGILEWEAYPGAGLLGDGVVLNQYVDEWSPGKDFVRVRSDPRVNVEEEFTVAVWIKSFSFGQYRSVMANTDDYGYALCIDRGRPSFWIHVDGAYLIRTSSTRLKTDLWYHLALTFDGARATLYVNGEPDVQVAKAGTITRSRSDFFIGGEPLYEALDPRWPAFHGILDEFYFYDRSLPPDDLYRLFAAAAGHDAVLGSSNARAEVAWREAGAHR